MATSIAKRTTIGALLVAAGCSINPFVTQVGKICDNDTDLCPSGYQCYLGHCATACSVNADDAGFCNAQMALPANIFAPIPCQCDDECPCPEMCIQDPYFMSAGGRDSDGGSIPIGTVCGFICDGGGGESCPLPQTVCDGNTCVVNVCNYKYEPCDAGGETPSDGQCLSLLDLDAPPLPSGPGPTFLCVQNGTAEEGSACSPSPDRWDAGSLCAFESFCTADGTCVETCIPGSSLPQCQDVGGMCQTEEMIGVGLCE